MQHKITVKKDDFLKALTHVQSVVEKRNAIPILSNIKIKAEKGGNIELTATDMDICVVSNLSGENITDFKATLPATTLYEIIRKIPQNCDIEFILNEKSDNVLIKVGSSEFNLPGLPIEEFPSFEDISSTHNFKISSEVLKTLLLKTRHAIANEETRYYLNGIYMHTVTTDEGIPVLRAVATDGHRLARAQTLQPNGAEEMPGIIIPKKAVSEICKLLEDYAGEVDIALSNRKIVFNLGSSVLSSKLIDGKFPDYDRVIPKNNDKMLEIDRNELSRSIDLVISVSNDKTRAVKLSLEHSKVTISASSELNGNASGTQEIQAKFNSRDSITVGFNSKYVLDSLSAIDGNLVNMSLSTNLGAVIAKDANDNNFLYILMPMQV